MPNNVRASIASDPAAVNGPPLAELDAFDVVHAGSAPRCQRFIERSQLAVSEVARREWPASLGEPGSLLLDQAHALSCGVAADWVGRDQVDRLRPAGRIQVHLGEPGQCLA